MTWEYYSYYDLVRKDSFDCLSSLACVKSFFLHTRFKTSNNKSRCTVNSALLLYFIPIAEIREDVKIRGDDLYVRNGKRTSSFVWDTPNVGSAKYVIPVDFQGSFSVNLENGATEGEAFAEIYGYSVSRSYQPHTIVTAFRVNNNSDYPCRLYYNKNGNVEFDFSLSPRFFDIFQNDFSNRYPNQSVGLLDLEDREIFSYSASGRITVQDDVAYDVNDPSLNYEGDPITAPLFTIPFIRS